MCSREPAKIKTGSLQKWMKLFLWQVSQVERSGLENGSSPMKEVLGKRKQDNQDEEKTDYMGDTKAKRFVIIDVFCVM